MEDDPISFFHAMESFNSHSWIVFKENLVSLRDSLRTIMALVSLFDLELHQMDIITSFLNDDIEKTIYMVQIENFVPGDPKSTICKLTKNHLWIQASILSMVPQISLSDYLIWF